jgi:subtilisin family serine protease
VLGSAQVGHTDRRVGVGAVNDIDVGFKRAVDLGAKVLNLSFGSPLDELDPLDSPPHEDVVAYALAHGCILVAASGNSGRRERYSPAALDGVIAVGAADETLGPAPFSTSGDHVTLCAPGERVVAEGLRGPSFVTGTSFAAPFVTAAAALLVSRAARRAEPLDSSRVVRLLAESARPWSSTGSTAGHGAGTLDVLAALRLLDADLDRSSRGPPGDPNSTSVPTP